MDKLAEVIGDYSTFLKEAVKRVENAGFDMADFSQCDHMGYRTTSLDQYEDKKRQLSGCAKPIGACLQHHPHRGAQRAQLFDLVDRQSTGIYVRK